MLHDPMYHQLKAAIMQPIGDVYDMVEERTRLAVQQAQSRATALRWALIAAALSLLAIMAQTRRALRDILGATPDAVHAHITRIGCLGWRKPRPTSAAWKASAGQRKVPLWTACANRRR
jgi:uncharacterized BrkB/YihY/UPF0761 family membrane protein